MKSRSRTIKTVAAAVGAGFLLAACETESRVPTAPSRLASTVHSSQQHPHGHVLRAFRPKESSQWDNNPIVYHGGPIIYAQKVATIYWSSRTIYNGGPAPGTTGSGAADGSLMGFFLNHLGGSPYYNINTTYYDGAGTPVQNTVTYTQYWASNTNVPATGSNVSIGAIQAEIESGFTSGALTFDPNTLYLVFTDSAVDQDSLFVSNGCAEHSYFTWNGNHVKFGAMPRDYDQAGCRQGDHLTGAGSPNNDPVADAEVNTTAHETEETNTDPEPVSGWADSSTVYQPPWFENADKCVWMFGSNQIYTTGNGAKANMNLGGKDFLVQENWIAQAGGCDVERLIVSISGPDNMNCTDTYTWSVTASGLGSSFTYVWQQGTPTGFGNGMIWTQVGTGPTYTRQGCPSEAYLWLRVQATDNFGGQGLAYKTVSLTS
jgi:hypothetical protein